MSILIRIRTREGTHRFQLDAADDISSLTNQILSTSDKIDVASLTLSNTPTGNENLVSTITGNLQSLGLSHGDLLFANYKLLNSPETMETIPAPSVPIVTSTASTTGKKLWELAEEEEVDKYWEQKDGKIERKKGTDLCQCGPKAMCDYCMPYEPFDPNFQKDNAIKHLSFHSYLRKTNAAAPLSSKSTTYIPPLADPNYSVQIPCTSNSHPSWPEGICTKCQPAPVTLSRQVYRMVDHIEFSKANLVENLLEFWRKTGTQRFGYMLGRYEPYEKVPMGIKAVVEVIHEPPQEPLVDGISIGFPWGEESKVDALAKSCGLKVVGVIFTDLIADKSNEEATKMGKVIYKRHANSFFLSSLEVNFAAKLQKKYSNASKYSATGKFSSKFVTCVLSGDAEGGIAIEGYQVSDQAMGMSESDMMEPSVDPGIMRVKEELPTRYIPDVFYRYKNKYGIEVKESAKPCFPVEYLLVNVTHGFPTEANPLFTAAVGFNIENRAGLQEQSLSLVTASFNKLLSTVPRELLGYVEEYESFEAGDSKGKGKESNEKLNLVVKWFSDWHLLYFLTSVGIFELKEVDLMAKIVSERNVALLSALFETANWKTFLAICQSEAPSGQTLTNQPPTLLDGFEIPPDVDNPPDNRNQDDVHMNLDDSDNVGGVKACPHCTFENQAGVTDCEVCGLPV